MERKFGVREEMIWAANSLEPYAIIFPQTNLLIPTTDIPVVNWTITDPPSSSEVVPLMKMTPSMKSTNLISYVVFGVISLAAIVLVVLFFGVFTGIRKRNQHRSSQPLSAVSLPLSNFSPDFLDGMSKLKASLINFSFDELKIATENFHESSTIGSTVYRGRIGNSYVAIQQMNSEEPAHHVSNILTKINHMNIVKLEGCCYASRPYLVFEYAENGSLRDCLSSSKVAKQLTWAKRMQIAFDLAVGICYIHYCTNPAYVHRNINSRNVLITMDWRAKISGFAFAKPLICIEEIEESNWNDSIILGRKGDLAPEYIKCGLGSSKADIFAFGVILLELLSAKEVITDGNLLKDSVNFLADGGVEGSSKCLEQLKEFIDPALEGDYPLGDALCFALLAKGCVEEDPHHRPTVNDLLKALSRIV